MTFDSLFFLKSNSLFFFRSKSLIFFIILSIEMSSNLITTKNLINIFYINAPTEPSIV